jgi:transketolase
MRPLIRLAAMMGLHAIYVFTHDSIALGQDGSTHQPVEQLAGLRAVPGLTVIRPGHANERAVAWRVALEAADHPVALILTRQNVPTLDRSQFTAADGFASRRIRFGRCTDGKPDVILIASGSEVGLIMAARQRLQHQKVLARVVPCRAGNCSTLSRRVIATRCYCRQSTRDLPSKPAHRRAGIATSAIAVTCWA